MLDQHFCSFLEYELTKAFHDSGKAELAGFWCDGILLPESQVEYSKKTVNDKSQINLTAYMGKNGQDIYKLILKFGEQSRSRYARDLNLTECIPTQHSELWLDVDIENKIIGVSLE